ncbi:MAG: AAA family ATPase [Emcibacteraceae bacterium]|nr:AAA family ATPase [Emcibacteraceae bacterium]
MTDLTIRDLLRGLSATTRLEEMKQNIVNDNFILSDIALQGQITLLFAEAGSGKTLIIMKLLINAIQESRIEAENVYYINADDNYKGLHTKAEIAEEYGFLMINHAENNMKPSDILNMFDKLRKEDGLDGIVIVLDTLKKFADMMSKSAQKELMEGLRILCMDGATVIIAGHTNKHKSSEGELVYEGTGDTLNDIDCAYSMNKMSPDNEEQQVIEFRNVKSRGSNIEKASYQYSKTSNAEYVDLMNSVTCLSANQITKVKTQLNNSDMIEKYKDEIKFIEPHIFFKDLNQSQILEELQKSNAEDKPSRRNITSALTDLVDIKWEATKGSNNQLIYSLI